MQGFKRHSFLYPCPKSCTNKNMCYLVCLLFSVKQQIRELTVGVTSCQAQVWLLDPLSPLTGAEKGLPFVKTKILPLLYAGGLGGGPFSLTVAPGTRSKL